MKRRDYHPALERVQELFLYDPITGIFRAKYSYHNRVSTGSVVGSPNKRGYLRVSIDRDSWYLHDIAWLLIYGVWPEDQLDHCDTDPANNAINNLRPCNRSRNNANQRLGKRNTSGFKGVSATAFGTYQARLGVDGQTLCFGTYNSPEEAHAAYLGAARKYFGDFARGA